ELESAALGGNRNPQRVAREHELARPRFSRRRTTRAARFARAVDLQDALARGKVPGARDLLDQRFDVGAEELEGLIAALADQVKVPRMAVRVLEAEASLAEIDFSCDPRIDHPLQRAVHGGAADSRRALTVALRGILAPDEVEQIVGGEMSLLSKEHIHDQVALAGAFAAGGADTLEVGGWFHAALNR